MTQNDHVRQRQWPGLFVSFEGGDGVGKSTQIKILEESLQASKQDVVVTREPGGSLGAEEIRTLLVTGNPDRWSALTEALLMYASRADHLEKTIMPALQRGAVVLCDRFSDSSMAYQGIAGALGREKVKQLHDIVVGDMMPDVTFVLSLSGGAGLARSKARADEEQRFENKGVDFQTRVYDAFEEIADINPERCVIINADQDKNSVAHDIQSIINQRFSLLETDHHGDKNG